MLGTLGFTGSEHWAPFSFSENTALSLQDGPSCLLVTLSEHKISFILLAHGVGYIMQRIIYFSDYFKT